MITWDNLLTADSASGANLLAGYVSRHPNPVKDILDSKVALSFMLDYSALFATTARIVFEFFLVWLVLIVLLGLLHMALYPLFDRLLQWAKS